MSREVMQQALEALKSIEWHGAGSCWVLDVEKVEIAEAALREALAQPAQGADEDLTTAHMAGVHAEKKAQHQPLTAERLKAMAEAHVTNCYFDTLAFARAIETAHGIGAKT